MEDNQVKQTREVSEQKEAVVDTQPQDTKQVKTFTQDDVNSIVAKRVDKLNKQWEEKFNALEESIKLQSMSEAERQEHDYTKRLADLEAREKALADKENAYNKQQYHNEIESQLKAKGLPTDMADLLVGFDAETVASKIASMEKSFNTQVNNSIQDRVKASATTPVTPQEEQQVLLSMEQIRAMSTQDIIKNKELVDKSLDAIYGRK